MFRSVSCRQPRNTSRRSPVVENVRKPTGIAVFGAQFNRKTRQIYKSLRNQSDEYPNETSRRFVQWFLISLTVDPQRRPTTVVANTISFRDHRGKKSKRHQRRSNGRLANNFIRPAETNEKKKKRYSYFLCLIFSFNRRREFIRWRWSVFYST